MHVLGSQGAQNAQLTSEQYGSIARMSPFAQRNTRMLGGTNCVAYFRANGR